MQSDYVNLDNELRELLGLTARPLAITFADAAPDGIDLFDGAMPEPTEDGRSGRVPAVVPN